MPIEAGTRLGDIEILAPLGQGGMGEVYRARDIRLDREVAVKVLSKNVAENPDALERFEREAKAVAALSHPGIRAIHDFRSDDGLVYAVMELLDGESLREALESGPLPQRKVATYARQLAEALAAAHEKGIVHRDLKPDNVFVTREGHVKILDFGLAKLDPSEDRPKAAAGSADSPTVSRHTDPGTVLGTVGYMSPEQVRGEPADARSDIFSLGTIIYEMCTGQQAFRRATSVETMAAILREDPPALPPSAPELLSRIVWHCLEKQPSERFQSARDLAFDLLSLDRSSTMSGAPIAAAQGADQRPPGAIARWMTLAIAIATSFALGTWWAGRSQPGASAPRPASFQRLTDQPGSERLPSITPDGRSVFYVAESGGQSDVMMLRGGSRNPVNLTAGSSADDTEPAVSPDGERIAFRSERDGGGIFVMNTSGESVRRVSNFGFNPAWSPDGKEIVVSTDSFTNPGVRLGRDAELVAVEVGSGRRRELVAAGDAMQPSWSPSGSRVAYWTMRAGGQRDIRTAAADGSESALGGKIVTDDLAIDWSPKWAPDGRHLYFASDRGGTMNLWRVPVDESSGEVLGAPEAVTTPTSWSGNFSISADGRSLCFETREWRSTIYRVPFDPRSGAVTGAPEPFLESSQQVMFHTNSPDGERVAVTLAGPPEDAFVAGRGWSEYRRLTDDSFRDRVSTWSPDGDTLALFSDRSGRYQVWTVRPDGSELKRLTEFSGGPIVPIWSPRGNRMALTVTGSGWLIIDLDAGPHAGEPSLMPPLDEATVFWPNAWSADETTLVGNVVSKEATWSGVATYSFETGRYEVLTRSPFLDIPFPIWVPGSKKMILYRGSEGIMLLDQRDPAPRLVLAAELAAQPIGVAADGRWISYLETEAEGAIWQMTLE